MAPISISVYGRQVRLRGRGKESHCRVGELFLWPAVLPCTLPPPLYSSYPPWLQGSTCACLQGPSLGWLLWHLLPPVCVALGRSCPVSSVTFSHVPRPLPLIFETSLDFLHHLSHLCGPHVTSVQLILVAWPIGFPGQATSHFPTTVTLLF